MSNDLYTALINDFCSALTPEEAATFRETGTFCLEGVTFSLVYSSKLNPDVVNLMCELGPLGKVDEVTCYRNMLEMNFLFMYQSGPQMAIHPDTGMQVFISRIPLEGLTPELLMIGLSGTVRFAKQWKIGEFPTIFPPPEQ